MIIPVASKSTALDPNDTLLMLHRILMKLQEATIAIHELADQDYELEDSLEEALENLEKE